MVLESLVNPLQAKHHPLRLFFIGILFSSIALLFSLWIFRNQASLVMVFLTVIVSIPLMYGTLKQEEDFDIDTHNSEGKILNEHRKAITFLTFLFLGFVVGFSLWYVFLPASLSDSLFNTQISTIENINANILSTEVVGRFAGIDTFFSILLNNVRVLMFCIIFALFFGAGSIFILAWNASVISAAVGSYFRNGISLYAGYVGFPKIASYFHVFVSGILRYMIHGVFEIVAYFLGGLAGGILSVAILRHSLDSDAFRKVFYDSLLLILFALVFLIFGSWVEVYVTPLFF